MGAIPRFYQPHEVGTFPLQGEEFIGVIVSSVKAKASERAGCKHPIPPVVLFPSSDIPLFSWRMPASESGFSTQSLGSRGGNRFKEAGGGSTHYERLLVDVVHVQGDQVLPAAEVQPTLVLVHQEDPIVAGVEGETEGPRCFRIRQLCVEKGGILTSKQTQHRLSQHRKQRSLLQKFFFSFVFNMFYRRLGQTPPGPSNNGLLTCPRKNVCH